MQTSPQRRYPPQLWFVLLMALALVGIWLLLRSHTGPTVTQQTQPTATALQAAEQTNPPPTRPIPSPTPTPLPASYQDHLVLQRPIEPQDNDWVARFYPYGSRSDGTYPPHHGVEFVNATGTTVRAVADATVAYAGSDDLTVWGARAAYYGQVIILRLDAPYQEQPVYAVYGHLSEIDVAVGQHVDALQPLGSVGSSGVAEGPHLHFEVRLGDNDYRNTANPELWLVPHTGCGNLAGQVHDSSGQPIREALVHLYRESNLNVPLREITTYPSGDINSDPAWAEQFASGDIEAGQYVVRLYHRGRYYDRSITIEPGKTTFVRFGD